MKQRTPSSKPFAAWVTGLTDKYRFDPNVRTTVHIVLLELGLTLLSILIFGVAFGYAESDAATQPRTYTYAFIALILLNGLFGYLIALYALRPVRQSLSFQKRFLSNIAHEIRTPLAIIKTSSEVTMLDPSLPKNVRKTLEETIVELNRISETINNILSFGSLSLPKAMAFAPVDIGTVTRTVLERHQELTQSRGIMLTAHIAAGAFVNGNEAALEQVVTNLVKNAINFTPKNKSGKVTVDIECAPGGGVSITVTDTGIGIAQKDLYHVFEPFYRADTSRARGIGTGSSGLGLAIVNEIVRLHKGTIVLRSAVNHGTSIKVSFPPFKDKRGELPILAPSGSPHEATIDFS